MLSHLKKFAQLMEWQVVVVFLLILIITFHINPEQAGEVGVVGFFGLLYVWFLLVIKLVVLHVGRLQQSDWLQLHRTRVAALIAAVLVLLLGLRSVNQLSWIDTMIVSLVAASLLLYWRRRS